MKKGWTEVALGELMTSRGSIDPRRSPEEEFALLSIPAYDTGVPARVVGHEVGSAKQLVEPGDVLLSKIVPHIRRTWVVPVAGTHRRIASSEWIVFSDPRVEPQFLRHLLRSDRFHLAFMATVAGVGGSLLRARPTGVAKIPVPLPPLDEQRRIAAILDQADELRAKRRAAIAHLDSLTEAIFLEMFGDDLADLGAWVELDEFVPKERPICYGILKPGPDLEGGRPYVRVVDMKGGAIDASGVRRTTHEIDAQYRRSRLAAGDLLMSIRGHVGRLAIVPPELDGANITQDSARISLDSVDARFALAFLRLPISQNWMRRNTKGAAVRGLNIRDLRRLPIPQVGLERQLVFAAQAGEIADVGAVTAAQTADLDALFASLQARAFAGEL